MQCKLKVLFLIVVGSAIAISNASALAEKNPPPIFGDVTIGNKFEPDPLTVRGMSGGSIPGETIAGKKDTPTGPCTGFVDREPDHTLNLTKKFNYLKLEVKSPEDTTLIIIGPGGIWCNDEFEGKNPGIVGEWLSGIYKIWVGSYDKNNYLPYTVKISEKDAK